MRTPEGPSRPSRGRTKDAVRSLASSTKVGSFQKFAESQRPSKFQNRGSRSDCLGHPQNRCFLASRCIGTELLGTDASSAESGFGPLWMCCTTKHSRSSDKVQVDTRQQHMGCQHMGWQHKGCQHKGCQHKGLVARVLFLGTSRLAMG